MGPKGDKFGICFRYFGRLVPLDAPTKLLPRRPKTLELRPAGTLGFEQGKQQGPSNWMSVFVELLLEQHPLLAALLIYIIIYTYIHVCSICEYCAYPRNHVSQHISLT